MDGVHCVHVCAAHEVPSLNDATGEIYCVCPNGRVCDDDTHMIANVLMMALFAVALLCNVHVMWRHYKQ